MQVKLCIQYLYECGQSWDCANHIAGILEKLLDRLHPSPGMRDLMEHPAQLMSDQGIAPSALFRRPPDHHQPLFGFNDGGGLPIGQNIDADNQLGENPDPWRFEHDLNLMGGPFGLSDYSNIFDDGTGFFGIPDLRASMSGLPSSFMQANDPNEQFRYGGF